MTDEIIALVGPFDKKTKEIILDELPDGFQLVHVETENELALLKNAKYFITRVMRITSTVIESAPRLRLIQRWGVGYDKVDIEAAGERGIPVAITTGINAPPVSELVILLMLAVYRHLPLAHNSLKEGKWIREQIKNESYMIKGKLVGLIGLGNIGKQVAQKLKAFGADIQYFDIRRLSPEEEDMLGVKYSRLEDLLRTSDIISLHIPANEETKNLICSKTLELMKPSAVIINTSRGAVINEYDLAEALKNGKIMGAGLDTFNIEPPNSDNPLLHLDNVVVTPHIGGNTVDNSKFLARHCIDNIIRISKGFPLPENDVVNIQYLKKIEGR